MQHRQLAAQGVTRLQERGRDQLEHRLAGGSRRRVIGGEQLVDLHDQLGDRVQPCKPGVADHQLQQPPAGRDRAVPAAQYPFNTARAYSRLSIWMWSVEISLGHTA